MTVYQRAFYDLAPDMNPAHLETLAYLHADHLNGMPREFFALIARNGRSLGRERLAMIHASETCGD